MLGLISLHPILALNVIRLFDAVVREISAQPSGNLYSNSSTTYPHPWHCISVISVSRLVFFTPLLSHSFEKSQHQSQNWFKIVSWNLDAKPLIPISNKIASKISH